MFLENSAATFVDTDLASCSAGSGGALYQRNSTVAAQRVRLRNSSANEGTGIWTVEGGSLDIVDLDLIRSQEGVRVTAGASPVTLRRLRAADNGYVLGSDTDVTVSNVVVVRSMRPAFTQTAGTLSLSQATFVGGGTPVQSTGTTNLTRSVFISVFEPPDGVVNIDGALTTEDVLAGTAVTWLDPGDPSLMPSFHRYDASLESPRVDMYPTGTWNDPYGYGAHAGPFAGWWDYDGRC